MYRSFVNLERSQGKIKYPEGRRCLMMAVEDETCGIEDDLRM